MNQQWQGTRRAGAGLKIKTGVGDYLVGLGVPVADEKGVVVGGGIERNGDVHAAVDAEAAEGTGCLLHADGRKVVVAANLVLYLEVVGEVGTGRDGAVCSGHPILPGVLPLLNAIPVHRETCIYHNKTKKKKKAMRDRERDTKIAGKAHQGG